MSTTVDFHPGPSRETPGVDCTCGNPDGRRCEPGCGTTEPVEVGRHCCDPGHVYVAIPCAGCPLRARHA